MEALATAAPMPSFVKLLTSDLDRSLAFYEGLGFERVHKDPVFVHVRWAEHADLFLVAAPKGMPMPANPGAGVLVCFSSVQISLDRLAERAKLLDLPVDGPKATPWHTRELIVADPDGYRINFAEPVSA